MKNLKLKCEKCGYEVNILDSELMENIDCILCGSRLVYQDESAKEIASQDTTTRDNARHKASNTLNQIDRQLIEKIKQDIKDKGEDYVWKVVNQLDVETQLSYIEYLLQAKYEIKNV